MCPNLHGFGWGLGGLVDGASLVRLPSDVVTCLAGFLKQFVLVGSRGTGLSSILSVAVLSATVIVVNEAACS